MNKRLFGKTNIPRKKQNRIKRKSNFRIGENIRLILALFLGGIISHFISNYFFHKTTIDFRSLLIDNVIFEVNTSLTHSNYEYYWNSDKYLNAGRPFPYLQSSAIEEIYMNIHLFNTQDLLIREEFIRRILECKFHIEYFNERIRFRNDFILTSPENVKRFNPYIFDFFNTSIKKLYNEFIAFMELNREALIGE